MSDTEDYCPSCKGPRGEHGHMCAPIGHEHEKCDWCGSSIPNQRHLCSAKVKELSYICNSCGRTAVREEHLCDPGRIS